jgi:4a-hydroxytetrahydrobiopterin dehydratase
MQTYSVQELNRKRCVPCEGGVPLVPLDQANEQLKLLDGWMLTADGKRITKSWKRKNYVDAMGVLQRFADVAEAEQHHPDVHLENYRMVRVEIWTHAIGGLSENDFILAAKLDEVV